MLLKAKRSSQNDSGYLQKGLWLQIIVMGTVYTADWHGAAPQLSSTGTICQWSTCWCWKDFQVDCEEHGRADQLSLWAQVAAILRQWESIIPCNIVVLIIFPMDLWGQDRTVRLIHGIVSLCQWWKIGYKVSVEAVSSSILPAPRALR